jgi:hypothetical protein
LQKGKQSVKRAAGFIPAGGSTYGGDKPRRSR